MADNMDHRYRLSINHFGYDKWDRFGQKTADHAGNWFNTLSDQSTDSFRTNRLTRLQESVEPASTKVTYNPFRESNPEAQRDDPLLSFKLDTGHPFNTVKRVSSLRYGHVDIVDPTGLSRWRGPLVPNIFVSGQPDFISVPELSENEIARYGSAAIAKTTPTKPHAQLSLAVALLFEEKLPKLPAMDVISGIVRRNLAGVLKRPSTKTAKDAFRQALNTTGDEYLNYAFGYAPLVADIVQYLNAVTDVYKNVSDFVRNGQPGHMVRRRYSFPQETTSESFVINDGGASLYELTQDFYFQGIYLPGKDFGTLRRTDTITKSYRFSGAYTYYAGSRINGILGKLEEYAKRAENLLGLELTPQTLWQAAPWSWLVDWQLNVSDFLANASNFSENELVMRYGYLMRETLAVRTYSLDGIEFKQYSPGSITLTYRTLRKERVKAFPYGFGVSNDPSNYTDQQWSILTALFMTNGAKALR